MMVDINKDLILIEQTEDTPSVILDRKNMRMTIEGPSFPEDSVSFYDFVLKWLDTLDEKFTNKLILELDFTILSSASNKMIFEIFLKMEKIFLKGNDVQVLWYYEGFDEDMFEEGRGFRDTMKLPIQLIEK